MNAEIRNLLIDTAKEYGQSENIITETELMNDWDRSTAFEEIRIESFTLNELYRALVGLGRIVREDSLHCVYATTVKVKHTEALLIAMAEPGRICLAACAHEGLIHQQLAEKALNVAANRIRGIRGKVSHA